MKVVIDIESNGLKDPTQIWLIVCKDIVTGKLYKFRNVTSNDFARKDFEDFAAGVDLWIGHHILGYDFPVLNKLVHFEFAVASVVDTLIVSKLANYSRPLGHSLESYGTELGLEKGQFTKFFDKELYNGDSLLFREMEEYCVRDVEITHRVYSHLGRTINDPAQSSAIRLEQSFQHDIVNKLHEDGFGFNTDRAGNLLDKITKELEVIDGEMATAFPPREVLIREFTPKATKYGTISKTSVPRLLWDRLAEYEVDKVYRHTKTEPFNPSSHKQLIEVLSESGWSPTDKTQTHIEAERELSRLRYSKQPKSEVDLATRDAILLKLDQLKKTGWKINETNLGTLPASAPSPARLLAKRILLEARRRTLTEWLGLVSPDTQRIHGDFYGIGAWTHRMAHQHPNTANIPTEAKLYGSVMRSLWRAPRNRLLVGVDAEGIQLRIFAHYIDDPEFTDALVRGKKDDKSDPHSLNQRVLGAKSRNIAKRFIFAYLLGAGIGKLAQLLEVSQDEARVSLDRLLDRYKGLQTLKETLIPADARRGWFLGLDGRRVPIPGDTPSERAHLCMSGYLQNGEAIVVKHWACLALPRVRAIDPTAFYVGIIHDEKQIECANDVDQAIRIGEVESASITEVGKNLGLKCPLAGSFYNDDTKKLTIGPDWKVTH